METQIILVITCGLLLGLFSTSVIAACSGLNTLSPYSISETEPNGSYIINGTKDVGDQVAIHVDFSPSLPEADRLKLQGFFNTTGSLNDTSFSVINTYKLDLEFFVIEFNIKDGFQVIIMQIGCAPNHPELKTSLFIRVEAVNEFRPQFVNAPYARSVSEGMAPGTTIIDVSTVTDEDQPPPDNYEYAINPYQIDGYGAEKYFYMPTRTPGRIVRNNETLDYDTMPHHQLFLNVSVKDSAGNDALRTDTCITITVTDADDQAPFWNIPGCPIPCPAAPFSVTVRETDHGTLSLRPQNLHATDPDTLGTCLIYSIRSGGMWYGKTMFVINANTGVITQTMSIQAAGYNDSFVRLVLEVRKDIPDKKLSNIAVVTVNILERSTNDTSALAFGSSTEIREFPIMPMVILAILDAILAVTLVFVIILYRRQQKRMKIRPEETEPQVDEEHLDDSYSGESDIANNIVFGNQVTHGVSADFPDLLDTNGMTAGRMSPLREPVTKQMAPMSTNLTGHRVLR